MTEQEFKAKCGTFELDASKGLEICATLAKGRYLVRDVLNTWECGHPKTVKKGSFQECYAFYFAGGIE